MKKRLDLILYELGYFDTKNKAQANILALNVKIDGEVVKKAGELFELENFTGSNPCKVEISSLPFVSRGGLKLQKALEEFKIDLKNRLCIDIGASTGGFTDCMLQAGAKKVWATDVGHNQLAWKLRTDERVVVVEKTNIKNCGFEDIFGEGYSGELPSFLAMDLSFISVKKVLENVKNFISKDAELVILIKPQFEAGREEVQKGGVVKDEEIHKKIIEDIENFAKSKGFSPLGLVKSPILGTKSGNVEYLMHLRRIE